MRQSIQAIVSVVLISSVVGCGDSYDKIAADMLANMKLVNQALKTVVDKSSADAAAPKIRGLGVNMTQIKNRMNELGKPTKEQGDQLNSKFSAEITTVGNEIAKERNRINGLGADIAKPINDAFLDAIKAVESSH